MFKVQYIIKDTMLIVLTFKVQQEKATVRKTSFKKHRDNSYDKFKQLLKTTALLGTDSSIFQEYSQDLLSLDSSSGHFFVVMVTGHKLSLVV